MSILRLEDLKQYSDTLRTRDGETVNVRFVEPRDTEELQHYFRSLSTRSRYNRFFGAMAQLPAEYAHEPKVALAGGADGMNLVKTLVRQARGHLKRGGTLIVEVGDGRAAAEKTFGNLALTWLTTSAGDNMVFLARQDQLP